jgi:hypothetical protein
MKKVDAKILLRLSALFIFIHLLGHCVGHLTWKDANDQIKAEVIRQMTTHRFEFMGAMRSIGDYFEGYSTIMIFVYLMMASILWLISGEALQQPRITKKVVFPIAIALTAFCIIECLYFFPFAATISGIAAILACLALMKMTPADSDNV